MNLEASALIAALAGLSGIGIGFLATTPQERAFVRWPLAVVIVACVVGGCVVAVSQSTGRG